VYQHSSGLDFIYFHTNGVWGIGPKIGGNSAGLLNFGTLECPLALVTPWEFGTKDKAFRRQASYYISIGDMTQSRNSVDLKLWHSECLLPNAMC
jgi:hypothetical protein